MPKVPDLCRFRAGWAFGVSGREGFIASSESGVVSNIASDRGFASNDSDITYSSASSCGCSL